MLTPGGLNFLLGIYIIVWGPVDKTQTPEQESEGSQHSPIAAAGVTQTVTKVPVETSGPFLSMV